MGMEVEELEKRMEELKAMGEKQEARVNYYDTKLHPVIVAYFIWERVFFFAIPKTSPFSTSLSCDNGNWWVILALSSLCSFVYILLFLDAALMLYRTEQQLTLILQKQAQLYRDIWTIRLEEEEAHTIDSSMEAGDRSSSHGRWLEDELMLMNSNPALFRATAERKFYLYAIFCALIGVASLELYACKFVLCN